MFKLSKYQMLFLSTAILLLLPAIPSAESFSQVKTDKDGETTITSDFVYTHEGNWSLNASLNMDSPALSGIKYGNNEYVMVGQNGTLAFSKDGRKWKNRSRLGDYTFSDIVWTGKQYVIWGKEGPYSEHGKMVALLSADGLVWKKKYIDHHTPLKSVSHVDGNFIGLNLLNQAYTSTNGVHWKPLKIGSKSHRRVDSLYEVNGILIAKKNDGSYFAKSKNGGKTWTEKTHSPSRDFFIRQISWNGQYYIGVGGSRIYKSADALTWENITSIKNTYLDSLAFDGKSYVAAGAYFQGYNHFTPATFTSKDLKTWKMVPLRENHSILNLVRTKDGFVGISPPDFDNLETTFIHYSKDGLSWETNWIGSPFSFDASATNGKQTILVGSSGGISYTKDGMNWVNVALFGGKQSPPKINDIVWDNNKFVAVGTSGVYISENGAKWSHIPIKSRSGTTILNHIAWNKKQLLAVDNYGSIYTSKDGYKWSSISTSPMLEVDSLMWDGQKYILTQNKKDGTGRIMYSIDGKKWTSAKLPFNTGQLNHKVVKNSHSYITTHSSNMKTLLTSKDGVDWDVIHTNLLLPDNIHESAISVIDDQFVVYASNDSEIYILYSKDGENWNKSLLAKASGINDKLPKMHTIVKSHNQYIFAGKNNIIFTIPDLSNITSYQYETN